MSTSKTELRELMANHIAATARLSQMAANFEASNTEANLLGLAHAGQEAARAQAAIQVANVAGQAARAALAGNPVTPEELEPVFAALDERFQQFCPLRTVIHSNLDNIANAAKGVSIIRHNERRQTTPNWEPLALQKALDKLDEAVDANWPPGAQRG